MSGPKENALNSGLEHSYVVARKVSHIARNCMWVLTALCVLASVFVIMVSVVDLSSEVSHWGYWLTTILTFVLNAGITSILAMFFHDFSDGPSPFGRVQSRRLFTAAIFEIVVIALGIIGPIGPDAPISLGALSLNFSYYPSSSSSSIDIGHVVEVVFLLCLSAVFRYGNALKEDSDSIL